MKTQLLLLLLALLALLHTGVAVAKAARGAAASYYQATSFSNAALASPNTTTSTGQYFGTSVATSGAVVAVGVPQLNFELYEDPYAIDSPLCGDGKVVLFTCNSTDGCTQGATVLPAGTSTRNRCFGTSVALTANGQVLVVGAIGYGTYLGATYVYSCTSATNCTTSPYIFVPYTAGWKYFNGYSVSAFYTGNDTVVLTTSPRYPNGAFHMIQCTGVSTSCTSSSRTGGYAFVSNSDLGLSSALANGLSMYAVGYNGGVIVGQCTSVTSCSSSSVVSIAYSGSMVGYAIALTTTLLALGDYLNDRVLIFVCNGTAASCSTTPAAVVYGSSPGNEFGHDLALQGNTLVVSSPIVPLLYFFQLADPQYPIQTDSVATDTSIYNIEIADQLAYVVLGAPYFNVSIGAAYMVTAQCASGCLYCLSNNSCVSTCPAGTVLTDVATCTPCDPSCAACAVSASWCTSCSPAYPYVLGELCVDTCPPTHVTPPPSSNSNVCVPCASTCLTCGPSSTAICTSCRPGDFLYNSQCYYNCPSDTYVGSGDNSSTCFPCDSSCATCEGSSSPSNCTSCELGYSILSGDRVGACSQCQFPCTSCVDTVGSCTACMPQDFDLIGNQCMMGCGIGYYRYNDTTYTCSKCDSTCATCTSPGNSTACTSCFSPRFLSGSTCVTVCDDGLYGNRYTGACEPCPDPTCAVCSATTYGECIECQSNYLLSYDGRCVPKIEIEGIETATLAATIVVAFLLALVCCCGCARSCCSRKPVDRTPRHALVWTYAPTVLVTAAASAVYLSFVRFAFVTQPTSWYVLAAACLFVPRVIAAVALVVFAFVARGYAGSLVSAALLVLVTNDLPLSIATCYTIASMRADEYDIVSPFRAMFKKESITITFVRWAFLPLHLVFFALPALGVSIAFAVIVYDSDPVNDSDYIVKWTIVFSAACVLASLVFFWNLGFFDRYEKSDKESDAVALLSDNDRATYGALDAQPDDPLPQSVPNVVESD